MKDAAAMNAKWKHNSCNDIPLKSKDIGYVFVQPNSRIGSAQEKKIAEFLNTEGIFQINLGVVIKEYQFKLE
jgi:hypothetical protein